LHIIPWCTISCQLVCAVKSTVTFSPKKDYTLFTLCQTPEILASLFSLLLILYCQKLLSPLPIKHSIPHYQYNTTYLNLRSVYTGALTTCTASKVLYTLCPKKLSSLACYNFDTYELFLAGTLQRKYRSAIRGCYIFGALITNVSALSANTENPETAYVQFNAAFCFASKVCWTNAEHDSKCLIFAEPIFTAGNV